MTLPRPASAEDVGALHDLREGRARWMVGRGVRQWLPGEVPPDEIAAQVAAGEWHVLRAGAEVVGALRLLWSDPDVWGARPDDAAYVHGLVIAPAHAGGGHGVRLLDWAAGRAAAAGRAHLRLDCVRTDDRLRGYYRSLGFAEVGRRAFDNGWDPVVLLERPALHH